MAQFTHDFEDTLKDSLINEELSFILPSTQNPLSGQLLLRPSVGLQGFGTECYEQEPMPSTLSWPNITSNYGSLQEQSHMGYGSPNLTDPALWVFNPLHISSLHQADSINTGLYGLSTWDTGTTNCHELHYSPQEIFTDGGHFDSPGASSLDVLFDTGDESKNQIPTPFTQNSVFALHSIPGSEIGTPGSSSLDAFFDIGDEYDYEIPISYEPPSYFTPSNEIDMLATASLDAFFDVGDEANYSIPSTYEPPPHFTPCYEVNAPSSFTVDGYFDLDTQSGCHTPVQTPITEESSITITQPTNSATTSVVSDTETVTQPPWIPEDIETMGYQDDGGNWRCKYHGESIIEKSMNLLRTISFLGHVGNDLGTLGHETKRYDFGVDPYVSLGRKPVSNRIDF
ncbi:hypothetical protein BP6252_11274 [Coleophoma cylindrospora]|uniref:Uncharacterized protein n=1 Tax=Coleophoma cylindrospora TaxID=1849047 RepID=A0A3D8QPK0_9HELO|nr:hypothetical protein BP6252_11274 [Coleophoma cylindrospora]